MATGARDWNCLNRFSAGSAPRGVSLDRTGRDCTLSPFLVANTGSSRPLAIAAGTAGAVDSDVTGCRRLAAAARLSDPVARQLAYRSTGAIFIMGLQHHAGPRSFFGLT
jgi:hypothetical protein